MSAVRSWMAWKHRGSFCEGNSDYNFKQAESASGVNLSSFVNFNIQFYSALGFKFKEIKRLWSWFKVAQCSLVIYILISRERSSSTYSFFKSKKAQWTNYLRFHDCLNSLFMQLWEKNKTLLVCVITSLILVNIKIPSLNLGSFKHN